MPSNVPQALGQGVLMTCYVDADQAGCQVTRRSHTGIVIFLNRSPILWFSKRQNTVETSSFTSEFIALRIAVELMEGLRYRLRMLGIPLLGPTYILCDNEAVTRNATHPESVLKRKHASISYHKVREAQAAGYIRIGKVPGTENIADLLTKPLPNPRMRHLLRNILW